jgi:hypothetical protein
MKRMQQFAAEFDEERISATPTWRQPVVYLKAIQGEQKSVRQKVNSVFAGVPVKPMTQDAVTTIQQATLPPQGRFSP